ncbi:MAG: YlmC/YmxH family sporulation protein [Peptococcaceae bacterium]|nr:YlmC/YmxH family sporulation protein [Peptococcaceae bacterium]MDH7524098.1 YlmC/YmxH family sporulation protein [Peptococcaceae bacterium]
MRLSELIGKDIVNIQNGSRLGTVADSDLVIQAETGEIESIILPSRGGLLNLWDRSNLAIPWSAVRKIGSEVIIVDLDDSHMRYKRYTY